MTMGLSSLIHPKAILISPDSRDRESLMKEMVDQLFKNSLLDHPEEVLQAVLERDKMGTTSLGRGMAIPHARTRVVKTLSVALAVSREGIPYETPDGELCHFIFMILAPPEESSRHIRVLSEIAKLSKDPELLKQLGQAQSPEELLFLLP